MSWDVSIVDKDDNKIVDIGNYSFNVSDMYNKAMGVALGDLHEKPVNDILVILREGIDKLSGNPEEYMSLEPKSKWGNYHGALQFLNEIYKACYEYSGMFLTSVLTRNANNTLMVLSISYSSMGQCITHR